VFLEPSISGGHGEDPSKRKNLGTLLVERGDCGVASAHGGTEPGVNTWINLNRETGVGSIRFAHTVHRRRGHENVRPARRLDPHVFLIAGPGDSRSTAARQYTSHRRTGIIESN